MTLTDDEILPSDPKRREKLKERIGVIIDRILEYTDKDTIRSEDIAEEILKEVEKEC